MARKNRWKNFEESARNNNLSYYQYVDMLTELALSVFEWKNVPPTVDIRFLELTLFQDGKCLFFKDEELGYLSLQCTLGAGFNVYRIPIHRRAYAVNGYQREFTTENSVIVWNNYLHNNSLLVVQNYAKRLYNIDRTIDVNVNAQKTPTLIQGTEQQRLTLLNLYKEFDGNSPVIFGDKGLDITSLKALTTGAPYVSDKLYELKTNLWNEALTYIGISNVSEQKKERMITDEVIRGLGGTFASRESKLKSRKTACKQINDMFGLDMSCDFMNEGGEESE